MSAEKVINNRAKYCNNSSTLFFAALHENKLFCSAGCATPEHINLCFTADLYYSVYNE